MSEIFPDAPPHWRVIRLRQTVTGCENGAWGAEPRGAEDDVVCVRVADFDRRTLRVSLENPTMRAMPETVRRAKRLRQNDLLLEKSGGGDSQPVGIVVLYRQAAPAVCSNFIARMSAAPGFDPEFLCYLHAALYAMRINCRSIHQVTGIQNLDSDAYLSEIVRIPDFAEQQRIARFLDERGAAIERAATVKLRMIDLLTEK